MYNVILAYETAGTAILMTDYLRRVAGRARDARHDDLLAVLALAVVVTLLLASPHGLLDKADRVAYAVCHRIPERTFTVAGRPLPLCARCSGTYLGAVTGLLILVLRGRGQAGQFPESKYLAVLGAFMVVWAFDGLNSYLTFFPGLPHLYEPRNILRLATGTLEGLAIAAIALPVFNMASWADLRPVASVGSWRDLAWMATGGALVVLLVSSGWPPLLYPLAVVSGLAVVALTGALNTMVVLLVLRRSGQLSRWRQAAAPILLGVALALAEIALVGAARVALESWLGWPF
jgi:uncharacterized membrane protein